MLLKSLFELLIHCNRLTAFLRGSITVESDERFQSTHRRFMLHLEGSTSLLSNEREWEYRDIFLAPVMYAVTTGMAFSIVHFQLNLALGERSAFLFY